MKKYPALAFFLASFAIPGSAVADVKVEQVEYHGWKACYRLSNGAVDLVVVPQIGRVMRYGFLDGPNILWENPALAGKTGAGVGWNNYGGDKTWPAPQAVWNWPPDPDIDGAAWTAEPIPNGVRITSPVSKTMNVRFVRDITLAAFGTEAQLRNRLENHGPAQTLSPWQVTQIDDPYSVFLPTQATSEMPKGWRLLMGGATDPAAHQFTADGIVIKPANTSYKFGAFSPKGEITASKGSTVFHMSTKVYSRNRYPDQGSALEVYMSGPITKYTEIELLGALGPLENGEGANLDVTWRLTQ